MFIIYYSLKDRRLVIIIPYFCIILQLQKDKLFIMHSYRLFENELSLKQVSYSGFWKWDFCSMFDTSFTLYINIHVEAETINTVSS